MQRADPAVAPCQGEPRPGCQVGTGAHRGDALILGAVIAGGAARRFGADKAMALHNGVPLIEHAHAAIAPVVDDMVLCGRALPGWVSLTDRPRPGLGPLGGIAAALAHAQAIGADHVLTIACDMPRVPLLLLDTLVAQAPAFCADAPILGLWPSAWSQALEQWLEDGGDRAIRRWARLAGATPVTAGSALPNINTPAELSAL